MGSTHLRTIIFLVGVMLGITIGEASLIASEIAVAAAMLSLMQGLVHMFEKYVRRVVGGNEAFLCPSSLLSSVSLATIITMCGIFLGIIRVQMITEKDIFLCEKGCTFTAVVISTPEVKDTYQKLTLRTQSKTRDVEARTPLYPKYNVGDTLEVSGKVSLPVSVPPHQGVRAFDYASYLLTKNIGSEVFFPKVILIDNEAHTVTVMLRRWKESLVKRVDMYVRAPEASLANGMLFGATSMSSSLTQTFRTAGLSHIVVLSGFNIAVLISSVLFIFGFLPLVLRIFSSVIFVCMFVIMTGAEASIIRATLMACIGLGATLFGREYIAKQALILSLLVIILYDPYLLLHDVSLHLSFLATAGIIYIREPCKNLLQKIIKNFSFFTETFATTCAAYLATLPYIMHTFGSVSVYALFSNMLVVPLVPFSMLLTCVVVVASYISQPLAFLVGYADTLLIKVMLIVAESVKRLPYASYSIELSVTGMCGAYIFEFLSIAFIFMKLGKKFQIKKSFVKNLKEDETLLTKDSEILSEIISY